MKVQGCYIYLLYGHKPTLTMPLAGGHKGDVPNSTRVEHSNNRATGVTCKQ